jgi:hypothetical protein
LAGDAAPAIAILIAEPRGFSGLAPPAGNRRAWVASCAMIAGSGHQPAEPVLIAATFDLDFRRFTPFRLCFSRPGSEISPLRG